VAANYVVLDQQPTVEFLGGSLTRPVMNVSYRTLPHNVYFEARIPQKAYSAAEVDATGKVDAAPLEALFTIPNVVDVQWTQTQRLDGTLLDQIVIGFTSSTGQGGNTVTVPWTGLTKAAVAALVKAGVEQLDDAEAL
jgi:hypothetical protein